MRVCRRNAVHNHTKARRRTLAIVGENDVVVIAVGQIVRTSASRFTQRVASEADGPFALHLEAELRGVAVAEDEEPVVGGLLVALHEQDRARVSRRGARQIEPIEIQRHRKGLIPVEVSQRVLWRREVRAVTERGRGVRGVCVVEARLMRKDCARGAVDEGAA